jgi:hypothetical protein
MNDVSDQVRTTRSKIMATIIEEDSPTMMIVLLSIVLLILVGGGLGLAYMGGVFTGKNEVIANDKRIEHQTLMTVPAH